MSDNPSPYDLSYAEDALNRASSSTNNIWISFCLFQLYLAVAVGSVSPRSLLFETQIQMPILSVELPLGGFFVVSPLVFLTFHAYLLGQLSTLEIKLSNYEVALDDTVKNSVHRIMLRTRTDFSVLVLAISQRHWANRSALSTAAKISVVTTCIASPLALLLLIQVTFLPHQTEWITWLHRSVILLDYVLVAVILLISRKKWNRIFGLIFALVGVPLLAFSWAVAMAPNESLYPRLSNALTYVIFESRAETATQIPSPFRNYLSLRNYRRPAVALDNRTEGLLFEGRSLRRADFSGSDLRQAEFRGSDLTEASFSRAKLSESIFSCVDGAGSNFMAAMEFSALQRSSDKCTIIRAANFESAEAPGAVFVGASAEGSSFRNTNLIGARFSAADLTNAAFDSADLTASYFDKTVARGANFFWATMYGARLGYSDFTAASFDLAQLQGSTFYGSDVRLADFNNAYINLAEFAPSYVWNVAAVGNASNISISLLEIRSPKKSPLIADAATVILNSKPKDESVTRRLNLLNLENDGAVIDFVEGLKSNSIGQEAYRDRLKEFLLNVVCNNNGANSLFIARGILHHRFTYPNDPAIATKQADPDEVERRLREGTCYGTKGMQAEEWQAFYNKWMSPQDRFF